MDIVLRIFIIAVSLFVFGTVIYMLTRRKLNESNSILWLFIAFLTLVFAFFPNLLNRISALVGIDYPPALLFFVSILVLMLIAFKGSIEISQTNAKVSELTIELSILKEENHRLAALLENREGTER